MQQALLLPALRQELQLLPGHDHDNKLLFDPVRQRYFSLSNRHVLMLQHWDAGDSTTLIARLAEHSIDESELKELLHFIYSNGLSIDPPGGDLQLLRKQQQAAQMPWWQRLLHNYLFLRIPLVYPDRFLRQTQWLSNVFFSAGWWVVMALLLVLGCWLTLHQWETFTHTFEHFFNASGLIYFGLTVAMIKVLHELGHAYAATRYGCRVGSMGVAFVVLLPVLFTDTSDAWRLTSRRQRLVIDAAGVAIELSIAIIATFCWAFLPDGPARSVAFFAASGSWIMSLAVNCNPLMRFDGYYFFSDAIGIANLQNRSFEFGRWALRRLLFVPDLKAPEQCSSRRTRLFVSFAFASWIYRCFLFVGIALLVHALAPKPFGLILAGIEVYWFILRPISHELASWRIYFSHSDTLIRARSVALFSLLLLLLCVPWQSNVRIPAVVEAGQHREIFLPHAAQLAKTAVAVGDEVQQGQLLMQWQSPALQHAIEQSQRRLALIARRLGRIAADAETRSLQSVLRREQQHEKQNLQALQEQLEQLQVRAPFDGRITQLTPQLHAGRWLAAGQSLLQISSLSGHRARGYLPADAIARITPGSVGRFIPDVPELPILQGSLSRINGSHAETISIAALMSSHNGDIAVNNASDRVPIAAWYPVDMQLVPSNYPQQLLRGHFIAEGHAEAVLTRVARRISQVLLRELSL
jgi:putative peptide zinc metalloprotease protein